MTRPTPRHIPPGREDLYRRQAEADAAVERLSAELDAADRKARDLADALDPDDSIVEDADADVADLLDAHNRAVAVADRVYAERTAGLSSWIDHDPTAPVCTTCGGKGCEACRGWGREYREPIPVWNDRDKTWVNPATGRTVDLLSDTQPKTTPAPESTTPKRPDLADLRIGRWYDTNPITTTGTAAGGTDVSSIEEVRAGIMASIEKQNEALGAVQHAHASLEEAHGSFMRAAEGSWQADASEVLGLLAQAVSDLDQVRQQVSAAISAGEGVGNRL